MTMTTRDITIRNWKLFCPVLRLLPAIGLGVLLLLTAACAAKMGRPAVDAMPEPVNMEEMNPEKMSMEEQWGVTVESLRTSANGHLLDFRYRIKDPDKAVYLVDRRNKAYLVDQASGKVLSVPTTAKVGPMRQTTRYGKPKLDRVYFVLFGNPGLVKPGGQVTVVIGDFRAENLVVQ